MATDVIETVAEVVEKTGLEKVLVESKLELSEQETIKQSYLPYFQQLAIIKEEAKKINYDNPSPLDETIARNLRLRTVKVRTGSETIKEERKRIYLLRANVEQQAWNLIKSNCQLDEEIFLQVEKKREIAEAKRKADLKLIREDEISTQGLSDYVPSVVNLGELSDDDYIKLHAGAQMQLTAKREAAAKAELDRIAREKAEAEQRELQRRENERLKAEAIEKEKAMQAEREKAEAERKKIEALRKLEQEKSDALLEEQRKKAAKEKAAADAKLKAANDAKAKAEAELKAKQAAEAKAKRDAELKAAQEERERIEAQRKAAAAPDKIKLKAFAQTLYDLPSPEMSSDEGHEIMQEINSRLSNLIEYIGEKTGK